MPAAEREPVNLKQLQAAADSAIRLDKDDFVKLVREGQFQIFDSERYEPYILIDRFQAPWHDARFRGYGSDKVSYINSVNTAKFHFKAHPDGWVIHRPHVKTKASDAFFASFNMPTSRQLDHQDLEKGMQLRLSVEALEEVVDLEMAAGTFVPVVQSAVPNCRALLPWWISNKQ
ncbi:MAG: hypothetical protein WDW36_008080 [Sanguina aurantia]